MVMLRQAGAAGRSTTGIGGYGSPRSRIGVKIVGSSFDIDVFF
jgi:hypothetical protein